MNLQIINSKFNSGIDPTRTDLLKEINTFFEETLESFITNNSSVSNPNSLQKALLLKEFKEPFEYICSIAFDWLSELAYENTHEFRSIEDYYQENKQKVQSLTDIDNNKLEHISKSILHSLTNIIEERKRNYVSKHEYEVTSWGKLIHLEYYYQNIIEREIESNNIIASKAQRLSDLTNEQIKNMLNQIKEIWKRENGNKPLQISKAANYFVEIWNIKTSRSTLSRYLKENRLTLN